MVWVRIQCPAGGNKVALAAALLLTKETVAVWAVPGRQLGLAGAAPPARTLTAGRPGQGWHMSH